MRVLVTGGCGFIGSNFINYILSTGEVQRLANLDKITYAGRGKNLEHMGLSSDLRYRFVFGDIADKELVERVVSDFSPEMIFNFAAESHVDRSISGSGDFVRSNVIGAINLMAASRGKIKRFIQVSTDEVYGSRQDGSFSEEDRLQPSSPYSASKASAELFAFSEHKTHGLPVIVTRSANNYGRYQHPEKFLPRCITRLIRGKKIPLMWSPDNPGMNVRDWLHVEDNCRAIWHVANKGKDGEIYNIPGRNERTNVEMSLMLLNEFGFGEDMIDRIAHRKGHDFRYSISGRKLEDTGFLYVHLDLKEEIKELVRWYKENEKWWRLVEK